MGSRFWKLNTVGAAGGGFVRLRGAASLAWFWNRATSSAGPLTVRSL
jgi:hypothetical protein